MTQEITKNTIHSFFNKTPYFKHMGWYGDGDRYYYKIGKNEFIISYLKNRTGQDFFEAKIKKLFLTKEGYKWQTILNIEDDYFMLIALLKQILKKLQK